MKVATFVPLFAGPCVRYVNARGPCVDPYAPQRRTFHGCTLSRLFRGSSLQQSLGENYIICCDIFCRAVRFLHIVITKRKRSWFVSTAEDETDTVYISDIEPPPLCARHLHLPSLAVSMTPTTLRRRRDTQLSLSATGGHAHVSNLSHPCQLLISCACSAFLPIASSRFLSLSFFCAWLGCIRL